MYIIANIIYGVPYTEKIEEYFEKQDLEPSDAAEELGFITPYDGSASGPCGYLGVRLESIDMIGSFPMSIYTLDIISKEDKEKVQAMIDKLPDDLQKLLDEVGLYIIVATS